jgi:hypothetical protein
MQSLALAHTDITDDIVSFKTWTETDFRTGEKVCADHCLLFCTELLAQTVQGLLKPAMLVVTLASARYLARSR